MRGDECWLHRALDSARATPGTDPALIAQGQSAAVARDRGALWFYALQGAIHFSALEENVDPIDIVERSLSR